MLSNAAENDMVGLPVALTALFYSNVFSFSLKLDETSDSKLLLELACQSAATLVKHVKQDIVLTYGTFCMLERNECLCMISFIIIIAIYYLIIM